MVQQLRKIPLAQDLVNAHGDAVGQVQAAAGVPHGHPDAVVLIGGQQGLRQPGILPPEDEVGPVRVGDVGVALGRFGGEVVERAAVFGEEIFQPVVIGDVQIVPVIQPGMFELFVVNGKAHGADQMQAAGGAGAGTGHVARVLRDARLHQHDVQGRFFVHRPASSELALRAEPGQQRLEPDAEAGVLVGGGLLDGQRDELGGVVGGSAQGVALDERADENGSVQVARAGEAAVDVQLPDDKAVPAGTGTADVFAHGQPGDDSIGGQCGQRIGQRLGCGVVQRPDCGILLQQQRSLGGVGQDEVCPAGQLPHPVDEGRGHGGIGMAIVTHHRVHDLAGRRPEVKGLFGQRDLLLAAEVAGVDARKVQPQVVVMLQRSHAVGGTVHPGRGAEAPGVGGEHHGGQRYRLYAHDR